MGLYLTSFPRSLPGRDAPACPQPRVDFCHKGVLGFGDEEHVTLRAKEVWMATGAHILSQVLCAREHFRERHRTIGVERFRRKVPIQHDVCRREPGILPKLPRAPKAQNDWMQALRECLYHAVDQFT